MNARDPVDRALELLRDERSTASPDAGLETRLRQRARELSHRRRFRIWPFFAVTAITGAAFAASFDRLQRWWFSIEIDGTRHGGVVEGDGERSFAYESPDGETGTVLVRREQTADGAVRTEIDVLRDDGSRVEHERDERVTGGAANELQPASVLEGALSLHSATDEAGRTHELFARPDGHGGSQLYVMHSEHGDAPVEELARVPFDVLGERALVEIEELPGGGLELDFDDGAGAALQFAWSCKTATVAPEPAVLETPDGKVRVRVDDLPLERGKQP